MHWTFRPVIEVAFQLGSIQASEKFSDASLAVTVMLRFQVPQAKLPVTMVFYNGEIMSKSRTSHTFTAVLLHPIAHINRATL